MAESFTKRLQNFFRIGVKSSSNSLSSKEIIFKKVDKRDSTRTKPLTLPSSIQQLWNWYLSQTSDSSETLKNRFDRYNDLEYMVYNDTIVAMAADLYADEVSQSDVQTEPIHIEAKKPKVREEIKNLLSRWGIDQSYVRETAWNIALYGDSFDINVYDGKNGIEEVIPQDVRVVLDRIEFKASEVVKKMKGRTSNFVNREPRLKSLVAELGNDSSDYAKYFKSYLIGYQLEGDLYMPPWGVNHYRNFSRRSEFWPFGRSLFIYSIGPFRQLKTGKNLMAMARALKFPKEQYEVTTSENMTEVEQWEAVNDARQEFQNLGVLNKNKDEFSVGGEIWIPSGLLKHESIENNLRIEDIADIELLRDDMIMGTRVPKGYLIVDRGAFGTSGQSLLQQFKPFGRAVYSVQSIILGQLTKLIKMHFLITGEFEKEFTEFQLSMNFPVIEEASDRLRMKNDTLRLAADVVSNIQSALGTRDGLPPDVVEMIFSKLSFLEPEDVKELIQKTVKGLEKEGGEDSELYSGVKSKSPKMDEKIRSRLNEEVIYDSYFEAMEKNNIQEGVFNSRHFFNSNQYNEDHEQVFSLLRRVDIKEMKG